jgi:hypothetical protein
MNVRALALSAAFAAALAGCSSGQGEAVAEGERPSGSGAPAVAQAAGNTAAMPGGVDPNLPEEIAMVVTMLKDKLPLRQGGATIVGMEARGAQIIHTIRVPQDLDAATFAHFQAQLPLRTCGDPQARWAVDRGGTATYKILDRDGELFTASVTGCPTAAPIPIEDPATADPSAAPPPVEGM